MSASFSSSSRKELAAAAPPPPWSDLLPELLESISGKITTLSNLIRFRSVCRSWRSSSSGNKHGLRPGIPFLILPNNPSATTCSFLNPTNGNVHAVDLPQTLGHVVSDSSNGWIVFVRENLRGVFLLNPVTRSTIQLPPLLNNNKIEISFFCLAFMESYPRDGDGFVASFTGFSYQSKLVYCRLGDPDWTQVHWGAYYPDSIAYHKGKLYTVNLSRGLTVWDVGGEGGGARPMRKLTTIPSSKVPKPFYLMVWDGEPVIVISPHVDHNPTRKHIEIFRLEDDERGDSSLRLVKLAGIFRDLSLFFNDNTPRCALGCDSNGPPRNAIYCQFDLATPYGHWATAAWFTPSLC